MDGKFKPPNIQVFINFRGDQLRNNFVGYLRHALRISKINVFIDNEEQRGEDLNTLFKRIEESGIAIVVSLLRLKNVWTKKKKRTCGRRPAQGVINKHWIYLYISYLGKEIDLRSIPMLLLTIEGADYTSFDTYY